MQVREIKTEGLNTHIEVQIPISNVKSEIDSKMQEKAKSAKVPGFRPGKVPIKIIEQQYKGSVLQDVLNTAISHSLQKIISDKKLTLASNPTVDNIKYDEKSDLEFTAVLEVMPEISDIDFSKIKVEKLEPKIDEEELGKKIQELLEDNKSYALAGSSYKSKQDDKVKIDFEGFVDGIAFEGGKGSDHELVIGSNTFIPGFEDQLVGYKSGAELDVNVTFPQEYRATNLAGKKSTFKVTIKEIYKPESLELNEESAKKLGFEPIEKLRESCLKELEAEFEEMSHINTKTKLFNELEKICNFDVPETILKAEIKSLNEQLIKTRNEDPEVKDKTDEEILEYATRISKRRIRLGLVLSKYAEKNNIKISKEDYVNAALSQIKGNPELKEMVLSFYDKNPDALKHLSGAILEEKAVKQILEKEVKIMTKKCSTKDLIKILDA